jgi:hypothetical protein
MSTTSRRRAPASDGELAARLDRCNERLDRIIERFEAVNAFLEALLDPPDPPARQRPAAKLELVDARAERKAA